MNFYTLEIKDIRKETPECVSIAFAIPEQLQSQFRFRQGQSITIKWKNEGQEIRRSYSICSSPIENELRVAVKKVPSGRFSAYANLNLKKGDLLQVLPPTGSFTTEVNAAHEKNYIAFAAGSGITPLMSIMKTVLFTETKSRFTLVYGNRTRSSIIFREALEALKNKYMDRFRVFHVLSREETEAPINYGRIDERKCIELTRVIDFASGDEFFVCGPEQMIYTVKNFLEKEGVDKKKIHFELFTVPGQTPATAIKNDSILHSYAGKESDIFIKLDGVTFNFRLPYEADSILDGALEQGADLPYACKGGVCSTCRARLVEGKVEMDVNYALEPEEIEAGIILTCQSHPRSERLVVDFDAK